MIDAQFPDKVQFLFEPHRYKILYGGRGGAKSWTVARALLILGTQRALRILCARETQKSIADSVHHLLETQIRELKLGEFYRVEKGRILGVNGTEFIFAGLKHNINNIKSVEACDIVWVEEAQGVSKGSWEVLIPTIRKEGSEIWATWNPDLEADDTYQRFVVRKPPGAVVVKIGWQDNPWFPAVLATERDHLKETDEDAYQHVWEGCCISVLEGAVYANELRAVDKEGRATRVPYDATRPVHTFWDLGYGDNTSIWFVQSFPFEFRVIDCLQNTRKALAYYLKELQSRPYVYGTHHLPWDGGAKALGTGKSIEELMRSAGLTVRLVPKLSVADGINAARTIFPQCWFDAEKCADGLQALRHYRYGVVKTLGVPTREPLHDEHSHFADAFRYLGVGIKPPVREEPQPERRLTSRSANYSPFG